MPVRNSPPWPPSSNSNFLCTVKGLSLRSPAGDRGGVVKRDSFCDRWESNEYLLLVGEAVVTLSARIDDSKKLIRSCWAWMLDSNR